MFENAAEARETLEAWIGRRINSGALSPNERNQLLELIDEFGELRHRDGTREN